MDPSQSGPSAVTQQRRCSANWVGDCLFQRLSGHVQPALAQACMPCRVEHTRACLVHNTTLDKYTTCFSQSSPHASLAANLAPQRCPSVSLHCHDIRHMVPDAPAGSAAQCPHTDPAAHMMALLTHTAPCADSIPCCSPPVSDRQALATCTAWVLRTQQASLLQPLRQLRLACAAVAPTSTQPFQPKAMQG